MELKISDKLIGYEEAISFMEDRVQAIRGGKADEMIWLLEHPPLYTAGTSAREGDLLDKNLFPVYKTGRGGEYTYHGPGQRIVYVMLDLKKRTPDVRKFVKDLETSIINTLSSFKVKGEIREGRVGVWVQEPMIDHGGVLYDDPAGEVSRSKTGGSVPPVKKFTESKIAALGVRIRQWVTYHGISINIHPDLTHYKGIIPCGISDYGVTSLKQLGINTSMQEFDKEFIKSFRAIF